MSRSDDLPIEAYQTEDDRAFAATLPARAWEPGGAVLHGSRGGNGRHEAAHDLTGRQLSLRAIAGRLLRQD